MLLHRLNLLQEFFQDLFEDQFHQLHPDFHQIREFLRHNLHNHHTRYQKVEVQDLQDQYLLELCHHS